MNLPIHVLKRDKSIANKLFLDKGILTLARQDTPDLSEIARNESSTLALLMNATSAESVHIQLMQIEGSKYIPLVFCQIKDVCVKIEHITTDFTVLGMLNIAKHVVSKYKPKDKNLVAKNLTKCQHLCMPSPRMMNRSKIQSAEHLSSTMFLSQVCFAGFDFKMSNLTTKFHLLQLEENDCLPRQHLNLNILRLAALVCVHLHCSKHTLCFNLNSLSLQSTFTEHASEMLPSTYTLHFLSKETAYEFKTFVVESYGKRYLVWRPSDKSMVCVPVKLSKDTTNLMRGLQTAINYFMTEDSTVAEQ